MKNRSTRFPDDMKTKTAFLATLAVSALFRIQAGQVQIGTNAVTTVFADTTLSDEEKAFVSEEWRRAVAPVAEAFAPVAGDTDCPTWESKGKMPVFPDLAVSDAGTTAVFSEAQSGSWLEAKGFSEGLGDVPVKLDEFVTNRLSRSAISAATDAELAELILVKAWNPMNPPDLQNGQTQIRTQWFDGTFFLPPRLSLVWLEDGISGSGSNLWVAIPVSRNGSASEMPAVFFGGRWYLTQWFSESGEKQW